ncbi:hypothetical protein [Nocardia farcinica]|uniref:hypothetical protein n=1 Tax=Nocardia farcinica TaxID=37329 RepID=UPI0011C0668C|nr:hypothetical protein [Nocardia farcinica]
MISAQTRDPGGGFVFDGADLPTHFGDLSVALGLACGDRLPVGQTAAHRRGDRTVASAGEFTATPHVLT